MIYDLLEGLRIISGLIYPVMPDTAATMQKHLGMDPDEPFYHFDRLKTWKTTKPGMVLPKSTTLFPRIDMDKLKKPSPETDHPQAVNSDIKPFITLETLRKVDLRVGTVIRAKAIPRAKSFLNLRSILGKHE